MLFPYQTEQNKMFSWLNWCELFTNLSQTIDWTSAQNHNLVYGNPWKKSWWELKKCFVYFDQIQIKFSYPKQAQSAKLPSYFQIFYVLT